MKIEDFLQEVSSGKPTPGGGSVAALAGSLGAALTGMVGNLTVKKAEGEEKEKFERLIYDAESLRQQLWALVDEDAASFNGVMEAFRMPKETTEEKEKRKEAIQEAFKKAAEVPLETMERALEMGQLAIVAVEEGNPNCITDAAVAVLMSNACLKGAAMNVRINLGSIKDKDFAGDCEARMEEIIQEGRMLEDKMEKLLEEAL